MRISQADAATEGADVEVRAKPSAEQPRDMKATAKMKLTVASRSPASSCSGRTTWPAWCPAATRA